MPSNRPKVVRIFGDGVRPALEAKIDFGQNLAAALPHATMGEIYQTLRSVSDLHLFVVCRDGGVLR